MPGIYHVYVDLQHMPGIYMVYHPWIYHVYPCISIRLDIHGISLDILGYAMYIHQVYTLYIHGYTWYIMMYMHGIYVVYHGISMDIPSFLKPDFSLARAAGLIQVRCVHACG
jgi:hypothetical protein